MSVGEALFTFAIALGAAGLIVLADRLLLGATPPGKKLRRKPRTEE